MIIYAEKGNKVRRINEADIQKYANDGYLIKDERGTVLRETVPTDINALRLAYTKHISEIKQLKGEIESLKSQIANMSKKAKASEEKVVDTAEGNTIEGNSVSEPKPRRRKSEKAE